MNFDGFWHHFSRIWSRFCSSICRMPTPPGTKRNNGKRQEHADKCRNMQKSNATKNADIETPIDNLQAAEYGFQPSLNKRMILGLAFLASVFRLFTHQTRHLVSSFNMENNQRIKAHLLRWFPAILEKYMSFGIVFSASVFRLFTHQTRHLVWSFNMENDQHIKAHLLR